MRVKLNNDKTAGQFADWFLQIGNGSLITNTEGHITFDQTNNIVNNLDQLINKIYPGIQQITDKSLDWWSERSILAPKNDTVDMINNTLIQKIDSSPVSYLAIYNTCNLEETVYYPVEFFNSLAPNGLPSYNFILKVGMPIVLLRNLNTPKLCNGTRLLATKLKSTFTEAQIITGITKGEHVCMPRIPMKPPDFPFKFKGIQFPIKPCFALTINRSQGQTLSKLVLIYVSHVSLMVSFMWAYREYLTLRNYICYYHPLNLLSL